MTAVQQVKENVIATARNEAGSNPEFKQLIYIRLTMPNNYKLKMQLSWLKAEIFITAGERSVACGGKETPQGLYLINPRLQSGERATPLQSPAGTTLDEPITLVVG
jgi:hypothetical protein